MENPKDNENHLRENTVKTHISTLIFCLLALSSHAKSSSSIASPVEYPELIGYRTQPNHNLNTASEKIYGEVFNELTKNDRIFTDQNRRKIAHLSFEDTETISMIDPDDNNQYLIGTCVFFPGEANEYTIAYKVKRNEFKNNKYFSIHAQSYLKDGENDCEAPPQTKETILRNSSKNNFKQSMYDHIRNKLTQDDPSIHVGSSGSGKGTQEIPFILGTQAAVDQYKQVYINDSVVPGILIKNKDLTKNEHQIRESLAKTYGCSIEDICFSNDHLTYTDIVSNNLQQPLYLDEEQKEKYFPELHSDYISLQTYLEKNLATRDMPEILKQSLARGLGAIESMFDHNAISSAGALTAYQVVPRLLGEGLEKRYGKTFDPSNLASMMDMVIDFHEDYFHVFRYGHTHNKSCLIIDDTKNEYGELEIYKKIQAVAKIYGFTQDSDLDEFVRRYMHTGYVGGYPARAPKFLDWIYSNTFDATRASKSQPLNGSLFIHNLHKDLGREDSEGKKTEKQHDIKEFMLTLLQLFSSFSVNENKTLIAKKQRTDNHDRYVIDYGFRKETSTYAQRISALNTIKYGTQ